jgi:hypothetical protein
MPKTLTRFPSVSAYQSALRSVTLSAKEEQMLRALAHAPDGIDAIALARMGGVGDIASTTSILAQLGRALRWQLGKEWASGGLVSSIVVTLDPPGSTYGTGRLRLVPALASALFKLGLITRESDSEARLDPDSSASPRSMWSAASNSPGLKIRWDDGWIEDFPEDEFAEECERQPGRIRMYKHGEKAVVIDYTLTVTGSRADIDYGGSLAERNSSPDRDIYIGVTRIQFTDTTRTLVKSILWKDEKKKRFEEYDALASWNARNIEPAHPFAPPKKDERKRRDLNSVLRPGQMRFRALLLNTYSGRCAVSGCSITNALEAAHIMPYLGPAYDHPQNGVLMRADFHRLFDALLWSIDPATMRICLSAAMGAMPDYAALQNKPVKLPRSPAARPSGVALEDHWVRFRRQS